MSTRHGRVPGKKGRACLLTIHSSPGKDQDDAVMYGSPSKEGASTGSTAPAPQSSTLETRPDAEQKDKGVLPQVLYALALHTLRRGRC